MIFTSHLLAGAAVASKITPFPLAIVFAFFSHYLLDIIPHSEYSIKNIQELGAKRTASSSSFIPLRGNHKWKQSYRDFLKIFLDFSAGILLILIFSKDFSIAFAGGIAAIIPDGLTFLGFIFPHSKILQIHRNFHYKKIHFWRNKKISPLGKFIAQFLTISIAVFFLLQ